MKLGTHNSLTSYPLLGWQKYFGWLINAVTRCQTKSIEEQLDANVRWFNLQVNKKDGRWIGSHGIAWYDVDLFEILDKLNKYDDKIYVQLYLDKHFGVHTPMDDFTELIWRCKTKYPNIVFQRIWNEQDGKLIAELPIDGEEKYWTTTWAKHWWQYLPCPKFWHKLYQNKEWYYTKKKYLMNDFV